jgi:hypothetical protein
MIVLIVVAYTAIYYSSHPEIAEEAAKYYREDLVKEGNKTPAEIDTMVSTARSQYLTSMISRTIFGTLITGAFFTALGAGLLLMRRR